MPDHTAKAYDADLEELTRGVAEMGGLAEKLIADSVDALVKRDGARAQRVIAADEAIDTLQHTIEEKAILTIARRQPMAVDLRMLVSTLKISNDLERVGDHAVNIAQCARRLAEALPISMPSELERMADVATGMLRDSIEAFIERDVTLAREVLVRDDEVDRYNDVVFRLMLREMSENTNKLTSGLQLMLVSRNLERIADLATNIAEDVVFLVEGRTIKHGAELPD